MQNRKYRRTKKNHNFNQKRLMLMYIRLICFAFALSQICAEDLKLPIQQEGFAEIATFTLSEGAICRKIDTYDSPYPLRWHLQPAWNQIQFEPEGKKPDEFLTGEKKQFAHCQMGINRRTLVGPLTKGEWKISGIRQAGVARFFPTKNKFRVTDEKGIFRFETAKPAVLRATALRYGNGTGACREYARLILQELEKNPGTRKILIHIPSPVTTKDYDGTKCRALPQTVAESAQVLEPGKYEVAGPHLNSVEIYELE